MPAPPPRKPSIPDTNDHKLCGFLLAVLSLNPPNQEQEHHEPEESPQLTIDSPLFLSSEGPNAGFRTGAGHLLSPVSNEPSLPSGQKQMTPNGSSSRKRRRVGHGGTSIVRHLHVLIANKCIRICARIIRVLEREVEGARAVVIVDVYLPLSLWSGWQFPKFGAMAASLFAHLSCNWEERNTLLEYPENYEKVIQGDGNRIWNPSDCHVLGCKVHCSRSGSKKKNPFELHEIFKNLPGLGMEKRSYYARIRSETAPLGSGIWDLSDDLLTGVLSALNPKDLIKVSATCRHLRSLAVSIMPCMKLRLFPHQQEAVKWMLQRERHAEVLPHPLYMDFSTEDGFHFYINSVSGEISTGAVPTITDFRGGLFCDEPGLGKTITALSLILKTHGTLAGPPSGVEVKWCSHNPDEQCGYYELSAKSNSTPSKITSSWKRLLGQNGRRGQISSDMFSPENKFEETPISSNSSKWALVLPTTHSTSSRDSLSKVRLSLQKTHFVRCTRSLTRVKRNLLETYGQESGLSHEEDKLEKEVHEKRSILSGPKAETWLKEGSFSFSPTSDNRKKPKNIHGGGSELNETWVQCDACSKWRKLSKDKSIPDSKVAWFCSMNSDPFHQNCTDPEESWDYSKSITYLPGFHNKEAPSGEEQNVSFFMGVLKEHCSLINNETKKALTWLANLSSDKLLQMETTGIAPPPSLNMVAVSGKDVHNYREIFQAFGLTKRVEKGVIRWFYPRNLHNLAFDLDALKIALTKPLDIFRLYLSRATLIVVPANLVEHWKNQIFRHVSPGQLRVYVWTDNKKPQAHNLAWDYDIVITTFHRLSIEWGRRKRSALMEVHWLRVVLDEGHTLGAGLNLTNKLQMAISLAASARWLLTGTPIPNTPSSQVAHLQPMLKFLHEEAYGDNQKSWECGILRPFEAEMEEGRMRLLELLRRCMISARKADLLTIPPCIKKITFLHFTEEHAKSYNELVVTVRRNILMADWNDPSHVESLLNPKQWKFRSNLIRNVRLSCCVAGHIKVTDAGQDIQETMDILVQQDLDPDSEEYVLIKYALLNGGNCIRCKEWCRLPVITPCMHLLCLDCVALDSERCTFPGCGHPYKMQSPEILTRPENPNPKWLFLKILLSCNHHINRF
ncbi:hypothetical protein AMTR_s00063p00087380 [Amborella trichopoda]|uniref:F-box domain-containing protein n=1 Tax=Amborella trichopoda TaxID=13333 RepID=U5D1W6_AMBTC|nr:hypothetical protein AMTR_s00063p00087380 [Amborella trichopoda]